MAKRGKRPGAGDQTAAPRALRFATTSIRRRSPSWSSHSRSALRPTALSSNCSQRTAGAHWRASCGAKRA